MIIWLFFIVACILYSDCEEYIHNSLHDMPFPCMLPVYLGVSSMIGFLLAVIGIGSLMLLYWNSEREGLRKVVMSSGVILTLFLLTWFIIGE